MTLSQASYSLTGQTHGVLSQLYYSLTCLLLSSYLSMFDNDPSLADDHHWYSMYHHSFKDVEVHGLRGEGGVTVSGVRALCLSFRPGGGF